MKKFVLFVLCALMLFSLCACGGESGTAKETPEITNTETVVDGITYTLAVPEDWTCEPFESGDYRGVCISPKDAPTLKFKLYPCPSFGVCGTGLVETDGVLGGQKVRIGNYDDITAFDFIVFFETDENFVVTPEYDDCIPDDAQKSYSTEALAIFDTVSFG